MVWNLTTEPADASALLRESGVCPLSPAALRRLDPALGGLDAAAPRWNDLPSDDYLRDGGRYRFRRPGCFVQDLTAATLQPVPHRAHWQPTTYNALHGGIERWSPPYPPGCWRRKPGRPC